MLRKTISAFFLIRKFAINSLFADFALLLTLSLSVSVCYSQKSDAEADALRRSQFVYNLTGYFRWPNHNLIKEFSFGVLGDEVGLVTELEKLSRKKTIIGKPFTVVHYTDIGSIKKTHFLYVHHKSGIEIEKVLKKISGYGTLLISEQYPYQTSMINIVMAGKFQKIEINDNRLQAEGITYFPELAEFAVKSYDEWRDLYLQADDKLQTEITNLEKEKEKASKFQEKIEQLNEIKEVQTLEIGQKTNVIKQQKKEIEKEIEDKKKLITENETQQKNLEAKIATLREQEEEIEKQKLLILTSKDTLERQTNEIKEKELRIARQNSILSQQLSEIEKQRLIIYLAIAILVLIAGFGVYIYLGYREKQRINVLLQKNNTEIAKQKSVIEQQKKTVEEKNKNITASITYAKRIQEAILTSREYMMKALPEHFSFYRPRDIVSGDFYWVYEKAGISSRQQQTVVKHKPPSDSSLPTSVANCELVFFCVADCTGHGVPGALMSLIGHSLLNEVIVENGVTDPGEILNRLKTGIIQSLKQSGADNEARDGMDIALCVWHKSEGRLDFAGARNSLYHIHNRQLTELKGHKQSIGYEKGNTLPFTSMSVLLEKGDMLYLSSDGFVDQKGGADGKKYLYGPLRALLAEISMKPLDDQRKIVKQTFIDWKGDREQIDDVCVMGVRV